MAASNPGCDQGRLGRFLDGDLDEGEQGVLAAHLELCEPCREALEILAGGDRWLHEVRAHLEGDAGLSDPATGRIGDVGRHRFGSSARDGRRRILSYLEPPEDPRHLGRLATYQVQDVIGRGGMGLVLRGIDPALGRVVAIKVLAPELSFLTAARQRFAREARAAASVAHEHVVAIHAVDSWKDLPYLVMQYIPGRSLQERLDRDGPLGVREVLRIAMQVASGLAAAHAQGLVHRDVKPANILLENGVERVKITDFGLARAADDATLSQSGVVAGTPQYMAPEQARGEAIGPRSDLFSLGGVMYAMCSGHPPFRAETTMGVLRRVCEDTPRPLRVSNPEVPGWLAEIIAKLLAKDPKDRFQTAEEVAQLLGRCLVHLEQTPDAPPPFPPEAACPTSRRPLKRRGAVATGCLLLALGLGAAEDIGMTSVRGLVASVLRIETAAGPGRDDAPRSRWAAIGESRTPALFEHKVWNDPASRVVPVSGLVLETLRPVPPSSTAPVRPWRTGAVSAAAYSPDGRELALGCADGTVALCTVATRRVRAILPRPSGRVWSLAFSPDGKTLATAGGEWERDARDGYVTLWDVASGQERSRLVEGGELNLAVAFSGDGRTLAWGGRGRTVHFWETVEGRLRAAGNGHEATIRSIAFHPEGERLVSAGFDGTIRFWDVSSGREDGEPIRLAGKSSNCVAVSPDGRTLAANSATRSDEPGWNEPGSVRLWDWGTRRERRTLEGHRYQVLGLAFSPDGATLASAGGHYSDAAEVKLWDLATGRERLSLGGHSRWVECVAFSPDGATLVSAGGFEKEAGEVRVWDLSSRASPPPE